MSYSGNLTIQISDHLLQLVLLEGFFKEVFPKKNKTYMKVISNILMKGNLRKLSKFCDWDFILSLHQNDPDLSIYIYIYIYIYIFIE